MALYLAARQPLARIATMHGVLIRPERARLVELATLEDRLTPPPIEIYGLEDVVAAHRRIELGHGRGRVVLDVAGQS